MNESRVREIVEAVRARRGDKAADALFDAAVVLGVVGGLIEDARNHPCADREKAIDAMTEALCRTLNRAGVVGSELDAVRQAYEADMADIPDEGGCG
jgi:hypothetical protein